MSENISDQLVEALVDAGNQRIYAVTGDSLNQWTRTCPPDKRIV